MYLLLLFIMFSPVYMRFFAEYLQYSYEFICIFPYLHIFATLQRCHERCDFKGAAPRHTLHMSDLKSEKYSKRLMKMDLAHWTPKRLSR